MPFEELTPIVKTSPRCKAGVTIIKDGTAKLKLSFSEPYFRELGAPEKIDCFAGTGEDLGKVLIKPHKAGKFEVREMNKGGGVVVMRLPAGIEAVDREPIPCEVGEKTNAGVVVVLPLKAWKEIDAVATRIAERNSAAADVRRNSPHGNGSTPTRTTGSLDSKIDVVSYFKNKKHACERLTANSWRLDGDMATRNEMFTILNRHRRAAELPELRSPDDFY